MVETSRSLQSDTGPSVFLKMVLAAVYRRLWRTDGTRGKPSAESGQGRGTGEWHWISSETEDGPREQVPPSANIYLAFAYKGLGLTARRGRQRQTEPNAHVASK